MPLLKLQTTKNLSESDCEDLLAKLSTAVAKGIGKSEQYVMVTIEAGIPIRMSGQPGEAAFADIRSIGGLNGAVTARLSREICDLLQDALGVSPDRVYLNFIELTAADWGWNGRTFG